MPTGPVPIVVQLGGAGPVAGGLSQVVEAYARWPFEQLEVVALPTRALGSPLGTARRTAVALTRVVRLAAGRRTRPALLAVHVSQRGSFLREGTLARIGAALGVPYVLHVHGSSFAAFEAAHPGLVRFVVGKARVAFVLDDEAAAILTARGGTVVRLANAVDVREPTPKQRHVVFGGVVGERKGVDLLLHAWSTLPADVAAQWELLLYGPVQMTLPAVGDTVRLMGAVPHETLLDALDASTVAVLPSRAEAMPMFVLEAMAAGNAVVASDVGALPTVLEDGAGVVVPAGDADRLAAELQAVLTDDARRTALAAAAGQRIRERHDARVVARELEAAWLAALRR